MAHLINNIKKYLSLSETWSVAIMQFLLKLNVSLKQVFASLKQTNAISQIWLSSISHNLYKSNWFRPKVSMSRWTGWLLLRVNLILIQRNAISKIYSVGLLDFGPLLKWRARQRLGYTSGKAIQVCFGSVRWVKVSVDLDMVRLPSLKLG